MPRPEPARARDLLELLLGYGLILFIQSLNHCRSHGVPYCDRSLRKGVSDLDA
jgi:hypothetical protein